jgi:hypothetical protein
MYNASEKGENPFARALERDVRRELSWDDRTTRRRLSRRSDRPVRARAACLHCYIAKRKVYSF